MREFKAEAATETGVSSSCTPEKIGWKICMISQITDKKNQDKLIMRKIIVSSRPEKNMIGYWVGT